MRIGLIAQNVIERAVLAAGFVPTPIVESFATIALARSIMAATQLGVFEALAAAPLPDVAVATLCQTDPAATTKLLDALAGSGYLHTTRGRYTLTPMTRTWLLRDAPRSIRDYILFNYVQWDWFMECEAYVRTGQPIAFHADMTETEWALYQRAMYCIARLNAPEVALRIPVPRGAHTMLDIGGANGVYTTAICQRHSGLRATVLDLPGAITAAAPQHGEAGQDECITYQAGDALTADLGDAAYDLIFVANLTHHFDDQMNRDLACRVARALKPGGYFVIQEGLRERHSRVNRQFGALGDLFFAFTSAAGLRSFAEMAEWQRAACLTPCASIRLLTAPNQGMQVAQKR